MLHVLSVAPHKTHHFVKRGTACQKRDLEESKVHLKKNSTRKKLSLTVVEINRNAN